MVRSFCTSHQEVIRWGPSLKDIKYKGKTYQSVMDIHSEHAEEDVSYAAFYARVYKGWDIEKALTVPARKRKVDSYTVDGVEYSNLRQLAVAAGISYEAAVKRKERGFSEHQIFFGRKAGIFINNKSYPSYPAAYKELRPKAKYESVISRIGIGWSLDQVFEVVSEDKNDPDTYAAIFNLVDKHLATLPEADWLNSINNLRFNR